MHDTPPNAAPHRRAFSTGFEQRSGEMMVYGGVLVGLFALSVAIPRESFALFVVSAVAFAVAYYHWPLVQRTRAQLAVAERGFAVAGLGVISWDAIRTADIVERAVRSIRNAELHLSLSRPLPLALVEAERPSLARQLMYRVWRVPQPDRIVIKLEPLHASPEEIVAVVRANL